jgi:tetratricopeptide (TPR) repeat protein
VAALTVTIPAVACINESGTNQLGERVQLISVGGQRLLPYLTTRSLDAGLITHSKYTIAHAKGDPSFDNLNDLAVVLIRFGRLPEAVKLLQFLERKFPGNYQTASNIGTAYELMGKNEKALKWILEGVKRNPNDHEGTEWLHVQILKVKMGQAAQPLPGRSILNLDFGNDALPRRPLNLPAGNSGQPLSVALLGLSLRYQLFERIQFVAAPDPIVAGLLLDWANLELLAGTLESADVLYDAALRYGSREGQIIAARKKQIAKILAAPRGHRAVEGQCELCAPPMER